MVKGGEERRNLFPELVIPDDMKEWLLRDWETPEAREYRSKMALALLEESRQIAALNGGCGGVVPFGHAALQQPNQQPQRHR